eukprot:m.229776 g.229776  ORF g.229776 m.229776 type:complete len:590 (-) comp11955_c0_seq1:607-2376(-)
MDSPADGPALMGQLVRYALATRKSSPDRFVSVLDALKLSVHDSPKQDEDLRKWLLSLGTCISSLDENAADIVKTVLGASFRNLTESVLDNMSDFILALISAHGVYGGHCVDSLVRHYVVDEPALAAPRREGVVTEEMLFNTVHETLAKLVTLSPVQKLYLPKSFRQHFPNKWSHRVCIETYMANALRLRLYVPEISSEIISLCIQEMLKIDVDIAEEDAESSDTEEPDSAEGTARPDIEEGQFSFDDIGAVDEDEDDGQPGNDARAKLDSMMLLMLGLVRETMEGPDKDRIPLVTLLIREFERFILPTFQTRHVQFLLFYACSFSDKYCLLFIDRLLKLGLSSSQAPTQREAALGYLASFAARARFLDSQVVLQVLEKLAANAHDYVRSHQESTPDISKHRVFYAVCQAVFYILCFHMDDIYEANAELIGRLQLNTLVGCALRPLVFCSEGVATVFDRKCQRHALAFCAPYMKLQTQGLARMTGDGLASIDRLDDFFPYDPYSLRRTKTFFEGQYREWSQPDDEETQTPDSDDESQDDYLSEGGSTAPSASPSEALTIAAIVRKRERTYSFGNSLEERGFVGRPVARRT